jgi:metal-sulfur cluster biosynthetic enzyme
VSYKECLLGYVRQALFESDEAKDTELARGLMSRWTKKQACETVHNARRTAASSV